MGNGLLIFPFLGTPVSLIHVAPDISMQHLQGCKMEGHDLEYGAPFGEGSFSMVFKGRVKSKNAIVAIKKLKMPENNIELRAFDDFAKEVWMMRYAVIF